MKFDEGNIKYINHQLRVSCTTYEPSSNDPIIYEVGVLVRMNTLDIQQQGDNFISTSNISVDPPNYKVYPSVHVPRNGDVFKIRLTS